MEFEEDDDVLTSAELERERAQLAYDALIAGDYRTLESPPEVIERAIRALREKL